MGQEPLSGTATPPPPPSVSLQLPPGHPQEALSATTAGEQDAALGMLRPCPLQLSVACQARPGQLGFCGPHGREQDTEAGGICPDLTGLQAPGIHPGWSLLPCQRPLCTAFLDTGLALSPPSLPVLSLPSSSPSSCWLHHHSQDSLACHMGQGLSLLLLLCPTS